MKTYFIPTPNPFPPSPTPGWSLIDRLMDGQFFYFKILAV